MKTYVANLLGGPGIGKSSTAASAFGILKDRCQKVELVREYVKEWAWTGRKVGPFGQPIIYGEQLDRESILYGKVELIVTDSPLMLCPVYQQYYYGHDTIKHCVFKDMETAKQCNVQHVNFLLTRTQPYDPSGRFETEEVAKQIDEKVKSFLIENRIAFIQVDADGPDRVKFIADTLMNIKNQENVNVSEGLPMRSI